MRITKGDSKRLILEVNKEEVETITYVLGFCIGGISQAMETEAIKLLGQFEGFYENEGELEQ